MIETRLRNSQGSGHIAALRNGNWTEFANHFSTGTHFISSLWCDYTILLTLGRVYGGEKINGQSFHCFKPPRKFLKMYRLGVAAFPRQEEISCKFCWVSQLVRVTGNEWVDTLACKAKRDLLPQSHSFENRYPEWKETVTTLGSWTGFEHMRLKTSRPPKRVSFH